MAAIFSSALELVGNTPTVRLTRFSARYGCVTDICAKLEMFNPSGSVKDRPVRKMLQKAVESGQISPSTLVIEASGGGGGISLAMICAAMGLRAAVIVPDDTPPARVEHLKVFGARVVTFPARTGMDGANDAANALAAENPDSFLMRQFENPANVLAHREETGAEALSALGQIDYLVAGTGSGGTVSGMGEAIKAHCPDCRVVTVEPIDSPVLSNGFPGAHIIAGIGPGFVPENLNTYILDEVVRVRTTDCIELMRALAETEGLFCGISSGAALAAAVSVARRDEARGKTVLALLPDLGERYLHHFVK